jgi:hypothetical protein
LILGLRIHRAVVVVTVLGQVLTAIGVPLRASTSQSSTDGSLRFPCQERPCGCLTAEQCWAGDCCCFTLEEKVVWAAANGVTPPEHVFTLLERKSRARSACCDQPVRDTPCSHCQKAEKPAVCKNRWLLGFAVQQCQGHGAVGFSALNPSVPPESPNSWKVEHQSSGLIPTIVLTSSIVDREPIEPPPRD